LSVLNSSKTAQLDTVTLSRDTWYCTAYETIT